MSLSDSTKSALEKRQQQEKQAETDRAIVRDLAKVLGAEFDPSDHDVKQVRKFLGDIKAQKARAAAARPSAAAGGSRKPFSHLSAHIAANTF